MYCLNQFYRIGFNVSSVEKTLGVSFFKCTNVGSKLEICVACCTALIVK